MGEAVGPKAAMLDEARRIRFLGDEADTCPHSGRFPHYFLRQQDLVATAMTSVSAEGLPRQARIQRLL
jgi:hypothetical protein